MYALIINGIVERFPYSISDLQKDNPNTSFPKNLNAEVLKEWNVFSVVSVSADYNPQTQVAEPNGCQYNEGLQRWETAWTVRDKTPEELERETQAKATEVRSERNALIAESDWTQLDDTPITNAKKLEWAVYRQALRDIPQQVGFPWNVVCPEKP